MNDRAHEAPSALLLSFLRLLSDEWLLAWDFDVESNLRHCSLVGDILWTTKADDFFADGALFDHDYSAIALIACA